MELETVSMIATSPKFEGDDYFGSTGDGGGDDMGANRHRGQWGDLWSDHK